MKNFVNTLLCGLLMSTAVNGTNQHMICKTVNDIFTEPESVSQTHSSSRLHHSVPGKRGPQGLKGDRGVPGVKGQQGVAGVVDYKVVNKTIEKAINNIQIKMEDLERRLRLMEKINESQPETTTISGVILPCEGLVKGDRCYELFFHENTDVSCDEAVNICRRKSMRPADILTSNIHLALEEYIQKEISSKDSSRYFWTGMTYDSQNEEVKSKDGNLINYAIRWNVGYPESDNIHTCIGIHVHPKTSSSSYALFNKPVSFVTYGVVCEK